MTIITKQTVANIFIILHLFTAIASFFIGIFLSSIGIYWNHYYGLAVIIIAGIIGGIDTTLIKNLKSQVLLLTMGIITIFSCNIVTGIFMILLSYNVVEQNPSSLNKIQIDTQNNIDHDKKQQCTTPIQNTFKD